MYKSYQFFANRCDSIFKIITMGWKRKSEVKVQQNGKTRLGNCGKQYFGVKQTNDGVMNSENQISYTSWIWAYLAIGIRIAYFINTDSTIDGG